MAADIESGPRAPSAPAAPTVEEAITETIDDHGLTALLAQLGERLRGRLMISLRNHTTWAVELNDDLLTRRYGDYLAGLEGPVLAAVAELQEGAGPFIVVCDDRLVLSLVELLTGGGRSGGSRPERRHITSIEQRMTERTIQIVIDDLAASFPPLAGVAPSIRRMESNPRFAGIAREAEIVLVLRLVLHFGHGDGRIDIVLPRQTLNPVRERLTSGNLLAGPPDAAWEERLRRSLATAPVEVEGLLPAGQHRLAEIMAWRPGTTLMLDATPDTSVLVTYGGMKAWTGLMGRKGGRVAVSLDRKVVADD